MDGYALRAADWSDSARLPVQQRCYAGDTPEPLKPGTPSACSPAA